MLQRTRLYSTVIVLATALATRPAAAQDDDRWKTGAELGASVFFGNTSQTAIATSGTVERITSALGIVSRANFTYGEATDPDGVSSVNKRAWLGSLDLTLDPTAPVNVFVGGKIESAFEKRVDLRWSAGGGGRVQLLREGTGRAELSAAVLAEKTIPRDEAELESTLVAKWSTRFRYTRDMSDGRVRFESDTSYEPEFEDIGIFTLTSKNTFAFQLSEGLALQLSFIDSYDSEAESRGARTNNDGQLFFSIAADF